MSAKQSVVVTAILMSALFVLNSCTEKNYTINQVPTDSVHIRGTVYAWRCGVQDWVNNSRNPEDNRFGVNTGETATVTFIRDNGFVSSVETDSSSDFNLYLSAGSHKVVIETGYTFPPDTFYNFQLSPGDTVLPFDIMYDVADPLNITCDFSYTTIFDTLSSQSEWEIIQGLNQRTLSFGRHHRVFDIVGVSSPADFRHLIQSEYTRRVYSEYELPVSRESQWGHGKLFNVVEAFGLLQDLIDQDTTGLVPSNFSMYPTGVYGCMW